MWELDYREGWVPKNWCFWTVVLEKTLKSPMDCKEIQVHPKGNQSWIFIGRTDVEAETPNLWPPDAKSWLIATPFSFADFNMHPFSITDITMGIACFQGPVNPFSESSLLRIGLGTPDRCLYSFFFPSSSSSQLTSFPFLIALPPFPLRIPL